MSQQDKKGGHTIVLGNEKGGSGKSTTAMHIIVSLLRNGYRVGSIDLDSRQASLTRYMENRQAYALKNNISLVASDHHVMMPSTAGGHEDQLRDDLQKFLQLLEDLKSRNDFVVIDCPGHDGPLPRLAYAKSDTLITPINDSFVDLDLLARVDPETNKVVRPSFFSELVWESRKQRALGERETIDWIVMRNRTSSLDARNKRRVHDALTQLEKRINFRQIDGLGERVIYRELFLRGLTLLDVGDAQVEEGMTMSHVAARQELRHLMDGLNLPKWGQPEMLQAVAS